MFVYILYLFRKILRYPLLLQHLLINSSFPMFLIVRFGISVSFRYFGFVSVNLGMYVYILYLFRKILRYPLPPQHLLINSIFPIFLIVRFGISVSFWYFGFVSVNLGTGYKSQAWKKTSRESISCSFVSVMPIYRTNVV